MERLSSSYRDPAGFVFEHKNVIYRFISEQYFSDYEDLLESGLYKSLTDANRLISHREISDPAILSLFKEEGKIILPEQLPFISYPYEWCFSMWRDAALVTLKIAEIALEKGMLLKDATPFNIQFYKGRPVFIDTLSFEKYTNGNPWKAYRQFTECFLGPLLLMHYNHRDAGKLFLTYPDGIPLNILNELLPLRSKWNIHTYLHIHLQAKISAKGGEEKKNGFSKKKLEILIKGLIGFVEKLTPKKSESTWDNYYSETILGKDYLTKKEEVVGKFTAGMHFKTLIDLGANDGFFSLMLKDNAETVIAVDSDSSCMNALYKTLRKEKIKNILPIVSFLNNPSPAIGWCNAERTSLTQRLKGDMVLALALIHHLTISANLPFIHIALWLHNMAENLIIEFIPPDDEKVMQLLKNRKDDFPDYNYTNFINVFSEKFTILKQEKAGDTERVLFLMRKK